MIRNITGDSLSPLPYCTALVTLTHERKRADYGYRVHKTEREIRNLLFLNCLKLLVRDEEELEIKI